jgi:aspartate aminotransferase-like enzyme
MSGFHGLFIPGPTNMPFAVRQAMDVPLEDQRAPDFPAFTLPLFRDLKKVCRPVSVASHGKAVGVSTRSPMQKWAMCATASALW